MNSNSLPNARFAVIFTSQRPRSDPAASADDGYAAMAERMLELARAQPGFVGVESARGADGLGITVSYWTDRASIAAWQRHSEHLVAQELGRTRWYDSFHLVVAEVREDRRMHERCSAPAAPPH